MVDSSGASNSSSSSEELDSKPSASLGTPSQSQAAALDPNQKVGQKRTTVGGPRNLLKKRYRSELPLSTPSPQRKQGSSNLAEDTKVASSATTARKAATAAAARTSSTGVRDSSLDRSTSSLDARFPVGTFPVVPNESAFARTPFGWQHLSASRPAGATSFSLRDSMLPETLYPAGLSARELLLQEQMIRHRRAMLIAQLAAADAPRIRSDFPPSAAARGDLFDRLVSLQSLAQADYLSGNARFDGAGLGRPSPGATLVDQYRSHLLPPHVRQQQLPQERNATIIIDEKLRSSPPTQEMRPVELARRDNAAAMMPVAQRPTVNEQEVELPPCIENAMIPPLASRRTFPLGIDEDSNWLSEFHCFVRAELIEVYQASHEDVKARNSSIAYKQIGLRCRHCAHRTGSSKAGRSSAFPSSIRQIYQSFTMMLRDHFPNCDALQGDVKKQYAVLKDKPSQGATDSKRYWVYSGLKIGMADSKEGIYMTKETRMAGLASMPFGVDPNTPWGDDAYADVSLVTPSDRGDVPYFLFLLMSQVQPVRLTEAECIGNRRSLRVGLPGFACRFCCRERRLGLCRMFPARRRTLPTKILDFYDHIRRCPLCPPSIKSALVSSKQLLDQQQVTDQGQHRHFYDRVWTRLGHDSSST